MTAREAISKTATALSDMLPRVIDGTYTDSDFDRIENLCTSLATMVTAEYESNESYMPNVDQASWLPDDVIEYLSRLPR